jgi:hypothetical protein
MNRAISFLLTSALYLALILPSSAMAKSELPALLTEVIADAKANHSSDYTRLRALEDLAPENYLKARVQRPTAVRALKRLKLHDGLLIQALLQPSLELVPVQSFPSHLSEQDKEHWRTQVLNVFQVGAVLALTHQQSPHAQAALAYALENRRYLPIHPALCVLYGRSARHLEGVTRLNRIAQTTTGLLQESAIIGLGKTRQLQAFEVLNQMLTPSTDPSTQRVLLHAMGHLADRAAQKANPLPGDAEIRAKVTHAMLRRIDTPVAQPHETVALSSLLLVVLPNELSMLQSKVAQDRALKVVKPAFSRMAQRHSRQ